MNTYSRIAESLLSSRDEMKPIWDFLARTILPRKRDILAKLKHPEPKADHSSTACDALHVLVGAFLSHITPSGQPWMEYRSRAGKTEKHKLWFQNASEVTLQTLASTNFYPVIHEHFMENALYGSAATLAEEDPKNTLRFTSVPVGSFGIGEDLKGSVDKLCREFEYTPAQMVERWGSACPSKVQDAYSRPNERYTRKFTIWHLVTPRSEYTVPNGNPSANPMLMRYASVYMMADGRKTILEEGGYHEFPFLVTRFLKWTDAWGYAPGLKILDEIRRELKLDRDLDVLADVAAFPRTLIDAEQDGDLDYRPGSSSVIDRAVAGLNLPREWGSQGRYDIGMDRLARTQEKIQAAFYVPFLRVVSGVDRSMTATEVIARQSEQVIGISAAFSQFVADFDVMQRRIFAILFRSGAYNTAKGTQPDDIIQPTADGLDYAIELPGVDYHGRIVQAIQTAQKQSLDYGVQTAANYIQVTGDPSAMDCIDASKVIEFVFRSMGAPSDIFRTQAQVDEIRNERAAAAAQQQQLLQAETAAKAAQATR